MVENFRLHRADFENLLAMIRDDESGGKRLYRIDYDWTEPKDLGALGISDERVREYRSLFPKIGVPLGFYAYGEDDVYMFVASTQGIAVSGTSKSYVWRPEPPSISKRRTSGVRTTKQSRPGISPHWGTGRLGIENGSGIKTYSGSTFEHNDHRNTKGTIRPRSKKTPEPRSKATVTNPRCGKSAARSQIPAAISLCISSAI